MTNIDDIQYFSIRVKENKLPYLGQNVRKEGGWVYFERVNTKTGAITPMEINMSEVLSIEHSDYDPDKEIEE